MGQDLGIYGIFILFAFYMVVIPATIAVVLYVLNGIFLSRLLKNAGHRSPVSAWIPVWNFNSTLELGGIRKPWAWTAVVFGSLLLGSLIPHVGVVLSYAAYALIIILVVYVAKSVQAALNVRSTGGVVFAAIFPVLWVIYMAGVSEKVAYDRENAIAEGEKMPLSWFGESDAYAPFGVIAPIVAPSAARAQEWEPPRPPAPPMPAGEAAAAYETSADRADVVPTDLPDNFPTPRFGSSSQLEKNEDRSEGKDIER